jgi:hypothetical protein
MNISKNDIQKYYDDKQMKKKKTYNKIVLRIMRLMKETAEKGKNMCMYVVPEIILGIPIYDINECIMYIRDILKDKGFESAAADPNIIIIFWKLENKLIKPKVIQNQNTIENGSPQVYNQNNLTDHTKTIEYNSVRNIDIPQTFFFNH